MQIRLAILTLGFLAIATFELFGEEPVDFDRDIQPVLTRFGCNSGACHGKQRGQNGFQLSLLGFDSDFDHAALTKEGASDVGIVLTRPDESLLLRKASGAIPHGGGRRLSADGAELALLQRWIEEGAIRKVAGAPTLEGISVKPTEASFCIGRRCAIAGDSALQRRLDSGCIWTRDVSIERSARRCSR